MRKHDSPTTILIAISCVLLPLLVFAQEAFPEVGDLLGEGEGYPTVPHAITGTVLRTATTPYEYLDGGTTVQEFAAGTMYIVRSGDGTHDGLRCPVVIVEGFDRANTRDWPSLRSDLVQMAKAEADEGDDDVSIGVHLLRSGRDIVLVNFTDGTTHVQANGHLLTEVLAFVNANRHDAAEPLAVIGFSMGGLISRYSLAWCEANGVDHGVDLFVSYDSPQEGANVPLGVQEAVVWFNDFTGRNPEVLPASDRAKLGELLDSQNSPAARQMTLLHYETASTGQLAGPDPKRVALEADLAALGDYPADPRNVAIANGSGHGVKLAFDAGDRMGYMTIVDPAGFMDLKLYVHAVSSAPFLVFKADVDWSWAAETFGGKNDEHVTSTKYAAYAFDAAPGAYSETFSGIQNAMPAGSTFTVDEERVCFIPSVSALGLPIGRIFEDLSLDANLVDDSPFDEISYPGADAAGAFPSQEHVFYTTRTQEVIFRNLLGTTDLDGDGLSDHDEFERGTLGWNRDSEGDGMDDGWEVMWSLDPFVDDTADDPDDDGYSNLTEYLAGSNPRSGTSTPPTRRWDQTVEKLHAIGQAIQDYQAARSGALPASLTELVDDGHLAASVLLCEGDASNGGDPHPYDGDTYAAAYEASCSFFYLFSGTAHPDGGTWHDVSTAQFSAGSLPESSFPLVQCFFGASAPAEGDAASATALNLGLDLTTVFATHGDWEAESSPTVDPGLRADGDIACPLDGTVLFPVWSPWRAQPNALELELVPGRGAGDVTFDGRFLGVSLSEIDPTPFTVTVRLKDGETEVDSRTYRVRPARQAMSMVLSTGWNLVGFPLARTDDPVGLFSSPERDVSPVSCAYFWDAPAGGYAASRPSAALSPGLWVYAETAGEVTIAAAQLAEPVHELPEGWSLVGVCQDVPLPDVAALEDCYGWDPAALRYVEVTSGRGVLQAGHGYWLKLSTPCMFDPDTGELSPVTP